VVEDHNFKFPFVGKVDDHDGWMFWTKDGRYILYPSENQHALDLISEWRAQIVVDGWVNVYPDNANRFETLFPAKADADKFAMGTRIACIKVTGTEGVE
jgi:hypothetical protein